MSEATMSGPPPVYGYLAEFDSADGLLAAAKATRAEGYAKVEAYSPFPVHGVSEALGFHEAKVPWIIFIAGVTGALAGIGLQWYTASVDYPMNVGGRPNFAWPQFIPVTFECTVLFAAFGAVVGMLALNGLPRPNHPIFNGKRFEYASQDRFFLCIESDDPKFDETETRRFLETLNAHAVSEVRHDDED